MSSSTVGNTLTGGALFGVPGAVAGNQFGTDIRDLFSGGGGGGGAGGVPLDLEAFRAFLQTQNAGIVANQGALGDINTRLGGIGDRFGAISQGDDPRFAAFQQGQFGLLDAQRGAALRNTGNQLVRTGVTGSVALNEQNKVGNQFDLQQRALSGQLGLTQLGRQDRALSSQAGILGGQAGILGQQNQFGQLALQNLLAEPTLNIAQLAAQNQGQGGGGGKK